MKELTNDQIKEALRLCAYYASGNCEKCPLYKLTGSVDDCGNSLPRLALQLIHELEGVNDNEGN